MAYEPEEAYVLILQLLQLRVFNGVYDLVLEIFIHCSRMLVDSLSFVVLDFEFLS